jgi:hypothetical protein
MAVERLEAMAETAYFTQAKLNGRPVTFKPEGDVEIGVVEAHHQVAHRAGRPLRHQGEVDRQARIAC